jgi:quinolinate synthase
MQALQYPETVEGMLEHLRGRLGGVVPDADLKRSADLAIQVNMLKRDKRAVILGHNYMEPALFHSVPDYTGDSLALSRIAAATRSDIIVFCGVRFMAETAKILSPERLVLLPSAKGGCSLAESVTADDVRGLKELYPGVPVVTYVNTYADVKAESDYCCTSSNGEQVVRHLQEQGHDRVIFLPDEYLASNVARATGLQIIYPSRTASGLARGDDPENLERVMIGWRGRCEVHERFTVEDIVAVRRQYPDVLVLAHPECSPAVVEAADFSGSTTAMLRRVEEMDSGRYLLLTECAMGDNIAARNPQREMLRLCSIRCPHMAEITLDETLMALKEERYVIDVPEDIRERAKRALDRMIAIG